MCGIYGFVGQGTFNDLNQLMKPYFIVDLMPKALGITQEMSILVILDSPSLILKRAPDLCLALMGKLSSVTMEKFIIQEELRKELESKGYVFQSVSSDTEVIINGYLAWGENVVHKLNGMWAFAIFDSRNRTLFLSRDRFGEKPLYYYQREGLIHFASELSSFECFPSFDREM